MKKLGRFQDPLLDKQIEEIVRFGQRPVVLEPGEGIIVTTPDGLNHYRIRVDNTGTIVTELADV